MKTNIQKNEYLCSFKTQKNRHVGYHFFQTQKNGNKNVAGVQPLLRKKS